MTEKNSPISLETPPPDLKYHDDDYESDKDEDNILSFSGILCNFDEQDKVRILMVPERDISGLIAGHLP